MPNQTTVTLTSGVPTAPSGTVSTIDALMADGGQATLGAKADARSTATDTTAVSGVSVWKQISFSIQALVTAFGAAWTRGAGASDSNTQRVTIDSGQMGSLGQGAMAASVPVVLASNQSSIPVAATLAAETTKVIGVVQGAAASGATASGNPLPAAGLAVSAETVVTAGQSAAFVTDLARKHIVLPYANPENFVSGVITTAMTSTTSTALTGMGAPGAGLRNYVTQITVSNAHATVGTDIIIQDGSGGTTLYTVPAAAVYGGAVITFPTPLRQPTTNTGLFAANVTTGASTKVSASGYKGA